MLRQQASQLLGKVSYASPNFWRHLTELPILTTGNGCQSHSQQARSNPCLMRGMSALPLELGPDVPPSGDGSSFESASLQSGQAGARPVPGSPAGGMAQVLQMQAGLMQEVAQMSQEMKRLEATVQQLVQERQDQQLSASNPSPSGSPQISNQPAASSAAAKLASIAGTGALPVVFAGTIAVWVFERPLAYYMGAWEYYTVTWSPCFRAITLMQSIMAMHMLYVIGAKMRLRQWL